MAKIERVHETWSRPITAEYLARQASFGWKLVSVTWEREMEPDPGGSSRRQEDPPYGLRVAGDGVHLEENTAELEVLLVIMEGIVQDHSISKISDDLNRRSESSRLSHAQRVIVDAYRGFHAIAAPDRVRPANVQQRGVDRAPREDSSRALATVKCALIRNPTIPAEESSYASASWAVIRFARGPS